jgi:hypothetical protein
MVTNPKIGVFHFVFLKLPRAKGKMDIFGGQINVQFWGGQNEGFWLKLPIFKRNIFGDKVVQTYTLDFISLKV